MGGGAESGPARVLDSIRPLAVVFPRNASPGGGGLRYTLLSKLVPHRRSHLHEIHLLAFICFDPDLHFACDLSRRVRPFVFEVLSEHLNSADRQLRQADAAREKPPPFSVTLLQQRNGGLWWFVRKKGQSEARCDSQVRACSSPVLVQ